MSEIEIQKYRPKNDLAPGLDAAILAWADARTDAGSDRRLDLIRDKTSAVADFFRSTGKAPQEITALDVKTWQAELEHAGQAPATVYAKISRVSSFYEWALQDAQLADQIMRNPVTLARPKAPRAYQTESTQALDDHQVEILLDYVKARADAGNVVAKRDYALMLFYFLTGMRRAEVINLRWSDVKINGNGSALILTVKVKGGDLVNKEIEDRAIKYALLDYLEASGRIGTIAGSDPLWTRHDRAGNPGDKLTSHAFVKNLKRYAAAVGIDEIHLHQARHTYARIVAEESGSLLETQDALGHRNATTTRVYVQRLGVKKDRYSSKIARRFKID